MSGVQCTEDQLRGVWHNSIYDPHFINLITDYQNFLIRFLSPSSGTLLVQHPGGLDSFVLSSSELSSKIKLHHPALKFVNSLMESQNSAFGSHGFYVGFLCLNLLKELINLELSSSIARKVISMLSDEIYLVILQFLSSSPCNLVAKLDISRLKDVVGFIKSFIDRKNLGLSETEHSHFCVKLVQGFLESVSKSGSFGQVVVTTHVGRPTSEAKVLNGVLYKLHDPCTKIISLIREKQEMQDPAHQFRVVLFNIPLSFKKSEVFLLKYSGQISSEAYKVIVVKKLCAFVKRSGIDVIANQKYIDEEIKFELQRNGVLVLERLGTTLTEAVRHLTGCFEVSNVDWLFDQQQPSLAEGFIGTVGCVSLVEIGKGKYVHLASNPELMRSREESLPVVTLLLPILAPALEDNIKVMAENALHNLRKIALQPLVSPGRGCLEASLASMLGQASLAAGQRVSENEVKQVTRSFMRVFSKLAVAISSDADSSAYDFKFDSNTGHLFHDAQKLLSSEQDDSSLTCCCQSVDTKAASKSLFLVEDLWKNDGKGWHVPNWFLQDSITSHRTACLENFSAKVNAIKLAFQGASQLFQVSFCIFDR